MCNVVTIDFDLDVLFGKKCVISGPNELKITMYPSKFYGVYDSERKAQTRMEEINSKPSQEMCRTETITYKNELQVEHIISSTTMKIYYVVYRTQGVDFDGLGAFYEIEGITIYDDDDNFDDPSLKFDSLCDKYTVNKRYGVIIE